MKLSRPAAISWGGLLLAAISGVAAAVILSASVENGPVAADEHPQESTPAKFATTIVGASEAPGIPTGEVDALGNPVLANCTTCHATREPNLAMNDGSQLVEFHKGLTTQHGSLQCVACHNPNDYSQLRLASGEGVEFTDSIRLCAQCHGPQYRDYLNGAHGGMTGHWDLSQGPRTRNHCTVCHDAHAPKYQPVLPVFRPRDLPDVTHTEEHP
ncbi:cytochrome c3 family protein [Aeoliella sp.]|uniref:cytochrome c3 family protein n=1 Tax=Aeoliella sp. TaxID=2795800 RepID=UPI003CCBCA8D